MKQMNAALSGPKRTWTTLSLIEWSTQYLSSKGIEDARLNVELLLARALGFSRVKLYTNFDRPLDADELAGFKKLFRRRLNREPLQYILGETEFMGFALLVNSSVLIPRPETEQLVEKAVETVQASRHDQVAVLDIGTGSGNIAIALASLLPNVSVTAIDISSAALDTAAINISRHALNNITLLHADVLSEFLSEEKFDVIISNPPYVSLEAFEELQPEIKDYEPRFSTTDEGDGYRFIRRVAEVATQKLHAGGWLFMEIGYNQSETSREILGGAGYSSVEISHDYAGHPRIISARKDT